jgi:hypothetical protein
MAKNLSLQDFFPVHSGEVREAVPDYGDRYDSREGAPMELDTYRGLAKLFETGSARLLTTAKAEVAEGGPANMDELIDGLLGLERDAQALFSPLLTQAERAGAPWAEPLIRALEALRDCRWQIMALRADVDRNEQDEAAPAFSDAGSLRRFLDGLN